MRRSQFSIRTLLWLTLVGAAFLGEMALQKQRKQSLIKKWCYEAVTKGQIRR